MKTTEKISEFTIYRLSVYRRCLEQLQRENIKTVSSKDFALRFGLNSAQVRKDLAYFGEFGIRGMGYPVSTLKEQILNILGLAECATGKKTWKTLIIGAGKLGTTLLQYNNFRKRGFQIVAILDNDVESSEYEQQQQAGLVEISIPLLSMRELEDVIEEQGVDIVILTTPEDDAQAIADRVVQAGVHAILNFVPVQLLVPPEVKVRTVDMVAELQSITYHLNRED
jgi:redox-sensing transcriptional repressor